ncbi:MAG: hypothetical protein AAF824_07125 [Bacteroidota bacterium]
MAKKFLDALEDAFEDDVLSDIIPSGYSEQKKASGKKTITRNKPLSSSTRKKNLRNSLGDALNDLSNSRSSKGKSSGRKSFLDTIEEALEDNAFDDIIPQKRQSRSPSAHELESRFQTMITTDVLDRAKEIAISKGIRVKDVINIALKRYVDIESK